MYRAHLESFKEHLHIKETLFTVLVIVATVLVIAAPIIVDTVETQAIRSDVVDFCKNYLADEKILDEYETLTMVFQDSKRNCYVFTYSCDSMKLYDCKDNYNGSYNGIGYGFRRITGCRYDANELLKLTCGDQVDTTDISNDIFGTEKKPENAVCIIVGELKASLKKEISLSR